jgi:hypothetical protein
MGQFKFVLTVVDNGIITNTYETEIKTLIFYHTSTACSL